MVSETSTILGQMGYASEIGVVGGLDLELEWSDYTQVSEWERGYNSTNLIDFGDATSCATVCNNSWTRSQVVQSAGSGAIPEIYNTNGGQANDWAALAAYRPANGHPLSIAAPLSQLGACVQVSEGVNRCAATETNSPSAAFNQLSAALKASGVSAAALNSSTDIEHRLP